MFLCSTINHFFVFYDVKQSMYCSWNGGGETDKLTNAIFGQYDSCPGGSSDGGSGFPPQFANSPNQQVKQNFL